MQYKKIKTVSILRAVVAVLCIAPMLLNAQTLDRIKESGTINIGYVPDEAPFSSGSDGTPVGYSIELGKKIAEATQAELSLASLKINYVPTDLASSFDKIAEGKIDLLCGAATETLARRKKVAFSIPIYYGGVGVLVRDDAPPDLVRVLNGEKAHQGPLWRATVNHGLANHTYAVHKGTVTEEWIQDRVKTLGVILTVVTVDNHAEGVELVANKKADAYFADRVMLISQAEQNAKVKDLVVLDRYFTSEPIALGLARGDADFRLTVDAALSELYQSDEFMPIYSTYFGAPSDTILIAFEMFGRD